MSDEPVSEAEAWLILLYDSLLIHAIPECFRDE